MEIFETMLHSKANIKYLREITGLSQTKFGAVFGATKDMIQSYEDENVAVNPKISVLDKIAEFLGLSVTDLQNKPLKLDASTHSIIRNKAKNWHLKYTLEDKLNLINESEDRMAEYYISQRPNSDVVAQIREEVDARIEALLVTLYLLQKEGRTYKEEEQVKKIYYNKLLEIGAQKLKAGIQNDAGKKRKGSLRGKAS